MPSERPREVVVVVLGTLVGLLAGLAPVMLVVEPLLQLLIHTLLMICPSLRTMLPCKC